MARDDWRLRIELEQDDAGGLLRRLGLLTSDAEELARDLEQRRLAVTSEGGTVFVYGGSSLELERARRAIDAELEALELEARAIVTEHWLVGEERWDDEEPAGPEDATVAAGYAPWEVRIPCPDHRAARELADRLEQEGYGVVRRWRFVIAGCASREQAEELASRSHGEVEPGGELVWEAARGNPFAVFGGLGDRGGPM